MIGRIIFESLLLEVALFGCLIPSVIGPLPPTLGVAGFSVLVSTLIFISTSVLCVVSEIISTFIGAVVELESTLDFETEQQFFLEVVFLFLSTFVFLTEATGFGVVVCF